MGAERPKHSREKSATDMRAYFEAMRDGRQTVTRCCVPPCRGGVLHVGTAAEGREAARLHREERHPDVDAHPRHHLTAEQQRERAMLKSAWKRKKFQGIE